MTREELEKVYKSWQKEDNKKSKYKEIPCLEAKS